MTNCELRHKKFLKMFLWDENAGSLCKLTELNKED